MWDNAELLNMIANVLFAAAFILTGYGVAHYCARLPLFSLHVVTVSGDLSHVTMDQIEAIVKSEIQGNFFTIDLERSRAAFEKLPWVRAANVRRQWPDRLEVVLEAHVPLARWGNEALVDNEGVIFEAAYDGKLPVFLGPRERAKEIAIQYDYFKRSLAPLGLVPATIQVSERRAWEVRLANGMVLELGRENIESRLDRFVAYYDRTIQHLQRHLDYVDLRYPNGFAVRIAELRNAAPPMTSTHTSAHAALAAVVGD